MTKKKFSDRFKGLDLPLHGVRLPSFNIDDESKRKAGVSESISNFDFLSSLSFTALDTLISKENKNYKKYKERLDYELKTLEDLSFVDYILLVWNVINFCKKEDIPTGLGRGSAAGSLVLFLIGVTGIDPIKHELYFERFISKTRAKKKVIDGVTYLDGSLMCDIDLDICYYNRGKVIEYLESQFEGRTAKILTLNTLSSKLLIKECGKIVAQKPESEMNRVTALIPKIFGQVKDIEETYEEVEPFKQWCNENKDVYRTALKLRNLVKNKGVHASGVLLSYDLLEDSMPVELSSDKNDVSSFDMNWSSILNVKLDLLGLRGISVAYDVCQQAGIKITDIDLEDPLIYQNLYDLTNPHGLFQIEAETNFRVCQKVRPKNLDELSGVLALARPGALAFVDQYANYTNNSVYDVIHSFFDDILASTGGVCLYQEQMMKMANKIGFSLDEAELLRRIVGKKKVSEVKKWKKKIKDKVKKNKLDPEIGDILWRVLEDSANYSFNKSHSISYAALSAITVYLKFKYPQEFFLSLLKMTRFEPDPIAEISKIQRELSHFGIKLLPPHLIKSDMDFTTEGDDIRFGLLSIKGVSDKSIEKLYDFKKEYSSKFEIFQAAQEAKIGLGVLCPLIQAGALEGFRQSRTKVVYEAQIWSILTVREKRWVLDFGEEYDYDLVKIIKHLTVFKADKDKPIIKESRIGTIKKRSELYKKIYEINNKSQVFANWYYENLLLGYTYGKTLIDIYQPLKPNDTLMSGRRVDEADIDDRICFVGVIKEVYSGTSKNGNDYLRIYVADETSQVKVMIFSKRMNNTIRLNFNGNLPDKEEIVQVSGVKKDEVVFADNISPQPNKVYTKLAQVKNL
jgi:DNA polymerase-3 subunit alpha